MNLKKTMAFLLAAQMLLLGGISCSKDTADETEKNETTPAVSETTPAETDPAETKLDRMSVSDELPEITFGGKDFRFIANPDSLPYLFVEDQNGVATNDVIYDRNQRIESRFDIKIQAWEEGKEAQDVIYMYAMTDDHYVEIADVWSRMGLSLAADSLCLNWMDMPYINWDQPWWNKEANENGLINGKMFNVTGEMSVTAMQYTWAMAFNMDLIKNYGYTSDELYREVLDGEWTLDRFIEVGSSMYEDTNGDGIENSGDIFGFASFVNIGAVSPGVYGSRSMPWVHAIGENFYTINEDKTNFEITLGTEKVYSALEKLCNFHYNVKGTIAYPDQEDDAVALKDFCDGRVAIYPTTFMSCFTDFTNLSFDYGMLPYPKYDTAQERYYTVPFESYSIYQIPCTLPEEDYEMVGAVMEAMNAESWKTVSPTFYDEAMKGRYSVDQTTADILDLIMESRIFDWGYQVAIFAPGLAKTPFVYACMIADNNTDLASTLAENWDKSVEALELCISFYEDEYVNPIFTD